MATISSGLQLQGLNRGQLAALRKKARQRGTTPEDYVTKLIAEDLEMDQMIANKSLAALSAPIRNALKGTPEQEVGRIVEKARTRHHRSLKR